MSKLNILELHRNIKEKNDRKKDTFEKVLCFCHRRITMATENKQLRCYFEVPEYIVGYPLFDLNECIKYLLNSLQKNGFFVQYYFPKNIYISWDFDEMNKNKNSLKIDDNKKETLKIEDVNMLNMKKNTKGKYELNIY